MDEGLNRNSADGAGAELRGLDDDALASVAETLVPGGARVAGVLFAGPVRSVREMLPGVDALKPKFAQVRQLAGLLLRPSLCFLPGDVLGFAWQPDQVVLRPAFRVKNDPGVVLAFSQRRHGDGAHGLGGRRFAHRPGDRAFRGFGHCLFSSALKSSPGVCASECTIWRMAMDKAGIAIASSKVLVMASSVRANTARRLASSAGDP